MARELPLWPAPIRIELNLHVDLAVSYESYKRNQTSVFSAFFVSKSPTSYGRWPPNVICTIAWKIVRRTHREKSGNGILRKRHTKRHVPTDLKAAKTGVIQKFLIILHVLTIPLRGKSGGTFFNCSE